MAFTFTLFRNMWLAAFTSAIGTWVQRIAQQWLILSLTGSAFFLGLDTFLAELPLLLFTLIGGVIADRHDRRHLLMGSQALQMASALALTALVFFDVVRVQYILMLSFMSGLAQAFGGPAFQSLIPSLVPRQHLPNAVALNSIQFNLAQMVGPAIGGVIMVGLGMAACFGLNSLSFLAVIVVLGLMRVPPPAPATRQRILTELRKRLVSTFGARRAVTCADGRSRSPRPRLGPADCRRFWWSFADDDDSAAQPDDDRVRRWRHRRLPGRRVVGPVPTAWGGHAAARSRSSSVRHRSRPSPCSPMPHGRGYLPGCSWCGMAAFMMVFSLTNSLVQLTVHRIELRGRVISIYLLAFRGGMPLGSLITGYAHQRSTSALGWSWL